MKSPASTYLNISRAVDQLVQDHAENDRGRVARLILRATALKLAVLEGKQSAAWLCKELADEVDMSIP